MSEINDVIQQLDRRRTLAALAGASVFTFLGGGEAVAATVAQGATYADFESKAKFKVMWLVKRNPKKSVEEFQEAYLHHAQLIAKALGNSIVYYRLNFPYEQHLSMQEVGPGIDSYVGPQTRCIEWDCVTEMGVATPEMFEEQMRVASQATEFNLQLQRHEQEFIDYKSVISLYCKEYVFAS